MSCYNKSFYNIGDSGHPWNYLLNYLSSLPEPWEEGMSVLIISIFLTSTMPSVGSQQLFVEWMNEQMTESTQEWTDIPAVFVSGQTNPEFNVCTMV